MRRMNVSCACGRAALEVEGPHIASVECCCESCRKAGALLQSLPGAPPLAEDSGATRFVLYRKDRMRCTGGADLLREHRLTKDSATRRVIASCCNSPMFLEFTRGHWVSLYGRRFAAPDLPPLELRTMAGDMPEGTHLSTDVPNDKTHSLTFFGRLLWAWASMGFRSPAIPYVAGKLDTA